MVKKENDLHKLFIDKLKTLLDVENQIADALPLMIENATDEDLKSAFEEHLEETRNQAEKVKRCLEDFEEEAETIQSEAIRGLVKDADWVIGELEKGPVLDVALVSAAQEVEHYEIASYTAAVRWAEIMNHTDAANILRGILDEEEAANERLDDLALSKINERAVDMEETEEIEEDED